MEHDTETFGTKTIPFVLRVFACLLFRLRYDEAKLSRERSISVMGGIQGNGEEVGQRSWRNRG